MDKEFEREWLLALEKRFGGEATIAQVTLDQRPRMLIYYFKDFPAQGMLTAVTAGLSSASHPDWKYGKPELCFALDTKDNKWGASAAYLAQAFFNQKPFRYESTFALDRPMSGDSAMNACFVHRPSFLTDEQVKFELKDRTIFLAGLFPMYEEEISLYASKGFENFWNTPGFDPYNPRRTNLALQG